MSYDIPEGKLYNLSMIQEIAHGNNDFVKKMMALFIDTMPPAIEELKAHLESGNWGDLGGVAHKIKPSIDTMGISVLHEDIRLIERYGKEASNTSEIPALLGKVETVINRVLDDLKAELNA